MKRVILCFLVLATVPALSQTSHGSFRFDPQAPPFGTANQLPTLVFTDPGVFLASAGTRCEVNILQVSFVQPVRVMAVAGASSMREPSLSVWIENNSGKKVQAVDLLARIKVKDSIYQLDSTTREFPIHLASGEDTQRLQLADSAVGLESLLIRQVTYEDGTTWKPEHRLACSYRPPLASRVVAK
jgi:hypothetical protein